MITQAPILHDLRELRRRNFERRKQERREAESPKTPLSEMLAIAESKSLAKSRIDDPTVERLDAILTACEPIAVHWPMDAMRISDGLLQALLRLCLVKVTGKPLSQPEVPRIGMKLFQCEAIDRATMKRITASLKTDNAIHKLDTCRGLIVLLAR